MAAGELRARMGPASGDDQYQLDNAPWFVRSIAEGDIVRAVPAAAGEWPTYAETVAVEPQMHCPSDLFEEGDHLGDQKPFLNHFLPLGVTGEGAGDAQAACWTSGHYLRPPRRRRGT